MQVRRSGLPVGLRTVRRVTESARRSSMQVRARNSAQQKGPGRWIVGNVGPCEFEVCGQHWSSVSMMELQRLLMKSSFGWSGVCFSGRPVGWLPDVSRQQRAGVPLPVPNSAF